MPRGAADAFARLDLALRGTNRTISVPVSRRLRAIHPAITDPVSSTAVPPAGAGNGGALGRALPVHLPSLPTAHPWLLRFGLLSQDVMRGIVYSSTAAVTFARGARGRLASATQPSRDALCAPCSALSRLAAARPTGLGALRRWPSSMRYRRLGGGTSLMVGLSPSPRTPVDRALGREE